jgi:hypothetical protein
VAAAIAAGAEGQLCPGSRHRIPDRCSSEQSPLSTWQTPIPQWQSVGGLHCSLDAEGPWCERKLSAAALLLALNLLPAIAQ